MRASFARSIKRANRRVLEETALFYNRLAQTFTAGQIVKAFVPLAEMLKYAPSLTSMTAGKGSYVMEFSGYEEVPKDIVNRIAEEHKKEKEVVSSH